MDPGDSLEKVIKKKKVPIFNIIAVSNYKKNKVQPSHSAKNIISTVATFFQTTQTQKFRTFTVNSRKLKMFPKMFPKERIYCSLNRSLVRF